MWFGAFFFLLLLFSALLLVIRTGVWAHRARDAYVGAGCEEDDSGDEDDGVSSRELYIKEKCFPVDNNKTNKNTGTAPLLLPLFLYSRDDQGSQFVVVIQVFGQSSIHCALCMFVCV